MNDQTLRLGFRRLRIMILEQRGWQIQEVRRRIVAEDLIRIGEIYLHQGRLVRFILGETDILPHGDSNEHILSSPRVRGYFLWVTKFTEII